MPTVIDCAKIAFVAYGMPKDNTQRKMYRNTLFTLQLNWENIKDPKLNLPILKSPLYAELWLHHNKREAILGFRGTEINMLENDIVDAKTWWRDALGEINIETRPKYLHQAIFLADACKKYLKKHAPNAKLYYTGHSLGGAIAELMTTKERDISIGFNSPGIGHIKHVDTKFFPLIHNINARYGYINKVGKVIGSIDYIDVPEGEASTKIAYQAYDDLKTRYNEDNHLSLTNIKLAYNNYYEETDKKIIVFNFTRSAYPQHSMNNLLAALMQASNQGIANKYY